MTANVGKTNHPQFDNKMVVYGGLWWFMVVYGIALPTDVLGAEKKPVKSGVKIPPSRTKNGQKGGASAAWLSATTARWVDVLVAEVVTPKKSGGVHNV